MELFELIEGLTEADSEAESESEPAPAPVLNESADRLGTSIEDDAVGVTEGSDDGSDASEDSASSSNS